MLSSPGVLQSTKSALCVIEKIRFHKSSVRDRSKWLVLFGHQSESATLHLVSEPLVERALDAEEKLMMLSELPSASPTQQQKSRPYVVSAESLLSNRYPSHLTDRQLLFQHQFESRNELLQSDTIVSLPRPSVFSGKRVDEQSLDSNNSIAVHVPPLSQYAILEFEQPVYLPPQAFFLCIKLDTDLSAAPSTSSSSSTASSPTAAQQRAQQCRLAFAGCCLQSIPYSTPEERSKLRCFKLKQRQGQVERVSFFLVCFFRLTRALIVQIMDPCTLLVRNLFTRDTNLDLFMNLKVSLWIERSEKRQPKRPQSAAASSSASVSSTTPSDSPDDYICVHGGIISGTFGTSGKCKVYFSDGLPAQLAEFIEEDEPRNRRRNQKTLPRMKVILRFKKFAGALDKKLIEQ